MSNALAVAAVTRTIANLLVAGYKKLESDFEGIPDVTTSGIDVTTLPLDVSNKTNDKKNAVNLFLYHVQHSATWGNRDLPTTRPNETAPPLLGLDLFYLLTAYGAGNSDSAGHVCLGQAMSVLHDHPLLGRAHLKKILEQSRVHEQVERIRITSQPLSVDEMSKLWTTFQTQYRPSVAYAVSVLLIESTRAPRAALPVLTRGAEDGGAFVVASRAPSLDAVVPPRSQASAQLGDDLTISGDGLDVQPLGVRMASRYLAAPIVLEPLAGGSSSELRVHLPGLDQDADGMATWTPGFFTADVATESASIPGRALASNQVAWALAPRITVKPTTTTPGDVTLAVTCAPRVRDGQRVLLLLSRRTDGTSADERQIEPTSVDNPSDTKKPTTFGFKTKLDAGLYQVRLRVDGVDSVPVVWDEATGRPAFDGNQAVQVAS